MTRILARTAIYAALLCNLEAEAASPVKQAAKPQEVAPLLCDTRNSADYLPGVDTRGRAVAEADLPSDTNVVISTEVYPELRSQNPQLRGTGLAVRIDGLGEPPRCQPILKKPRQLTLPKP